MKKVIEKKLKCFELYQSKLDDKKELAGHLLKETQRKLKKKTSESETIRLKINHIYSCTNMEISIRGALANAFGYISILQAERAELNNEIELTRKELERRQLEFNAFALKSKAINGKIENLKQQLITIERHVELSQLDEWVSIQSFQRG